MRVLTDTFVSKFTSPVDGRAEIADARCIGLALRVTTAGHKSFTFKYRMRGRGVQRVTLGTYPALSLAKARTAADKLRQAVAEGIDPATQRREQRTGGRTFEKLAARYITEHAKRRKRPNSVAGDERNLRLHILPKWGKRDYSGIKRADVITLVEGVVTAGKQTLANRLQGLISKIYSFAIDAGLVDVNPCSRMAQRGVEKAGTRVLSNGELRLFWTHIVEAPEMRRAGLGLRLALLTGARIGEVAGASRSELQNIELAHGAEWLLPGNRVKNKRDHLIPLAPLALETMRELAAIDRKQQFLLPSSKTGSVSGATLTQFMAYFAVRLKRGDFGAHGEAGATWIADPPSPHDLRRTVETRLAELGVPKEYRDRVLNHVTPGVAARHYDRHNYKAEKLAALSKWEGLLQSIFAGEDSAGTVVALADRRSAT